MKQIQHGIYIAMVEEARILAQSLGFIQCKKSIWSHSEAYFHEKYNALLVTSGQGDCENRKISRVGKVSACLTTTLLIERVKPQWIWNVGTCGGITDFGAQIGDVYTGRVQQHDMHTPQEWPKRFVQRTIKTFDVTSLIKDTQMIKSGLISTGEAFDKTQRDWLYIENTKAHAVDMEAFAVADTVSQLMPCLQNETWPLILLKGVTDTITLKEIHKYNIHESAKDFSKNFKTAMKNVAEATQSLFENVEFDHIS